MGIFNFLKGAERQLNPFDNNKTYKDEKGSSGKASDFGSDTFHFLQKPIVGTGRTVKNTLQYGPESFVQAVPKVAVGARNLAVDAGRAFARIPATVITSLDQRSKDMASEAGSGTLKELKKLSYDERKKALKDPTNEGLRIVMKKKGLNIDDPSDENIDKVLNAPKPEKSKYTPGQLGEALHVPAISKVEKLAQGKEEVQSYQERYEGNKKVVGESRFRGGATPIALLGTGLTVGTDLIPGGGGVKSVAKTGGEVVLKEVVEQVAKETTEQGVKKILAGKVAPEVIEKIAPSLAKTTDKHVTENIIKSGIEKAAPALAEDVAPKSVVSVGNDILPAGKGSATPVKLTTESLPKIAGETPTNIPPLKADDPLQKIADAFRGRPAAEGQSPVAGLTNLQGKQKELTSLGRKEQLARAGRAGEGKTGEEALNMRLGAYSGEMQKADTKNLLQHVQSTVNEEDYTNALNHFLTTDTLRPFEQTSAANAWRSFYRDGKLPRPFELKLFEKAGGEEFAKTIKEAALENMSNIGKLKEYASQVIGLPKAIMASLDLSGGGRQGAFLGTRYAPQWLEGQKAAAQSFVSKEAAERYIQHMTDNKYAEIFDDMGLDLVSRGNFEEAFPTKIADKIPGVSHSDRAYTVGLSVQRERTAESILDTLEKNGFKINQKKTFGIKHGGEISHDLGELSMEAKKSLGKYINTASGRGDLGAYLNQHGKTLQAALFSPKLWKSRLDMLNPVWYARLDGPAKKLALQNAGTFAAVAAAIFGVAVAAGAEVETDARSSDFLKIKVGDTRYDILGGFQQNLVFAHRQLTGEKKNSITGNTQKFARSAMDIVKGKSDEEAGVETGPYVTNRVSVLGDLIKNKENPVLSTGITIASGKDKAGNPVNAPAEIGKLFIPLNIQDTAKTAGYGVDRNQSFKDQLADTIKGVPKSLYKATLPGTFGIGTGTYGVLDIQPSAKQNEYIQSIKGKDPELAKATVAFLQIAKTGPSRDQAMAKIKKALEAGDQEGAVKAAQEYNQKYADRFTDWRKQYSKYRKDEVMLKKFGSDLITDQSLERIIANLNKSP